MIQPRNYPELLAKSLVLEPEPFQVMAEDDDPVIEGLVLTALVGSLIGVARLIGGLLFSWSMPPAVAVESLVRQTYGLLVGAGQALPVRSIGDLWQGWRFVTGYDTGWARLFVLIWEPFLLLAQWVVAGLLIYAIGRALGGRGTLRRVVGASALVVAPNVLLLLSVVPFVAVSPLLIAVWSMLILYRSAQTAHGLPWQQAAAATVVTMALLLVLGLIASLVGAALLTLL